MKINEKFSYLLANSTMKLSKLQLLKSDFFYIGFLKNSIFT